MFKQQSPTICVFATELMLSYTHDVSLPLQTTLLRISTRSFYWLLRNEDIHFLLVHVITILEVPLYLLIWLALFLRFDGVKFYYGAWRDENCNMSDLFVYSALVLCSCKNRNNFNLKISGRRPFYVIPKYCD